MTDFITQALLFLPPFLLAISFHESAHAYIAYRFGDPTARDMGRITLNPLPHIDILGLIMLMTVHFGWAKPVMINP
ncbi:MAG TPA: site-2 protease family protein, partial [candidate division Zixibacteria bacterium]|nr:site-2 protease family protein [candidate division Zixibacteria bacterium]